MTKSVMASLAMHIANAAYYQPDADDISTRASAFSSKISPTTCFRQDSKSRTLPLR